MARVRQLDAQHATHRAQKQIKPGRRVGAQVTDNRLFHASNDEFQIDADLRWEASTKVTDIAATRHSCELDPDNDITVCTHPDHDRDVEWSKEALDWLGLPGDDLLPLDEPVPLEDYVLPFGSEQKKARLNRTAFKAPDWGWQESAACRGEDLELFFGPDGERQPEREIREQKAKRICWGCPVRRECLDYAVSRPEKHGTWGELNEEERAAERRRRMRRANAA